MDLIAYFVLGIYTIALTYITVYCLMQFNLLYYYKRGKRDGAETTAQVRKGAKTPHLVMAGDESGVFANDHLPDAEEEQEYPFVTIQLPIFNEMYVIERLIDSVMQFDYPKDRFEVHILDDSMDETVAVTQAKVKEYQAQGFNIEQICRENRQGYKAGALKEGMKYAKGEFLAIFDADFLPRPDFLKKTIPFFQNEKVGVVQTRWEHINEDYSLITRLQAMQLNVHFTVEQTGRMNANHMLQFNGTAGVWRRAAIEDAGGWEADTLTEDLDLSIRAQLKGWKINFLEDVSSPAELPVEMNSLKSQQFRWMKGGAETARKMLPTVWKSDLSLTQKIFATTHLLASSIFVFVFITGVFSVPLLYFLGDLIELGFSKHFFGYFLVGLLSIVAVYYVANVQAIPEHAQDFTKSVLRFTLLFPFFLALSMGLSLHNTVAVIQGFRGKKSPFVRTPKFNIKTLRDTITSKKYLSSKISWTTIMEGLLALYFLGAVLGGIYLQNTTFIVFHGMLCLGYGAIFYFSMRTFSLRR